nr:hypothetical protein CYJ35_02535 [Pseudoglutamicibacter albus]
MNGRIISRPRVRLFRNLIQSFHLPFSVDSAEIYEGVYLRSSPQFFDRLRLTMSESFAWSLRHSELDLIKSVVVFPQIGVNIVESQVTADVPGFLRLHDFVAISQSLAVFARLAGHFPELGPQVVGFQAIVEFLDPVLDESYLTGFAFLFRYLG